MFSGKSQSATDVAPGTISKMRITAFPAANATSMTVGTVAYYASTVPTTCPTASCAIFPAAGVVIPTSSSGNPTTAISVDPINGAVTVDIPYVAIDNANIESQFSATASVPFVLAPTAANGEISGRLSFNGQPIKNALVVLFDTDTNAKIFTRTNAEGDYAFSEKTVGKAYVVQPLSSKYSFNLASRLVNLIDSAPETNFQSLAKLYRPKNDFDGDGKTDYAVFRPTEGNWYIWQSKTQKLRVEQFGLAGDKLVPADFDGDGKTDVAVYRDGNWYIRRSSDGAFRAIQFGLGADVPTVEDFDGDGQADLSVYRPSEKTWYSLRSSGGGFASANFGLETDIPVAGDFDGDGYADIAQFRVGNWYVLNSTTGFESKQFGTARDNAITGDFDGDGRTDQAIYRKNSLSIYNSGDGTIKRIEFGLATDVLVK